MNYTLVISEYVETVGDIYSGFTPAYAYPLIVCFSENEVEMFLKQWASCKFNDTDYVILINGCVSDVCPMDDYKHFLKLADRMEFEFLPVVAEEFKNRR